MKEDEYSNWDLTATVEAMRFKADMAIVKYIVQQQRFFSLFPPRAPPFA